MPDEKATGKAPENRSPEKPIPPRRRGRSLIRGILPIGVPAVALAIAGFIYATGGRFVGTDDAFTKADTVPISADVSAILTSPLSGRPSQAIRIRANMRVQ